MGFGWEGGGYDRRPASRGVAGGGMLTTPRTEYSMSSTHGEMSSIVVCPPRAPAASSTAPAPAIAAVRQTLHMAAARKPRTKPRNGLAARTGRQDAARTGRQDAILVSRADDKNTYSPVPGSDAESCRIYDRGKRSLGTNEHANKRRHTHAHTGRRAGARARNELTRNSGVIIYKRRAAKVARPP